MPSKSEFPEHTPVSNQPEEEAAVKEEQQVSQPPSEGVKSEKTPVKDDDTEAVEDYKRTKAAAAELWTLPESIADLHDIGEASFGSPPPIAETVHGPDDRVQITNTSVYPWRVHASLLWKNS